MKIVICTTPIRPVPTDYPPFGALAIIQSLSQAGHEVSFYDIDAHRPSIEEVIGKLKKRAPAVVGVSAVVSTAYAYTKILCLAIKQHLPGTVLVVGGNLAASAEILHRRCGVDYCVVGEGEKIMVNLMRLLEASPSKCCPDGIKEIQGITFLDSTGNFHFTGHALPLDVVEMQDPDFTILEKESKIENFISDPLIRGDFAQDSRTYQKHRQGKKFATVVSSKGCVSRCTFCHRWDRGYRMLPPETVVRRIQYLKDRYNVGFIAFGDENFGSNRKQTDRLLEMLKPLDILYRVAGVRVRSVDSDFLQRLRDSGCVSVYYGMESGSDRVLQVMEKGATAMHNRLAAQWTRETGLSTIFQLVLGMPGESNETIQETIAFIKTVTEELPQRPYTYLSINYIQALPGTPAYEFARETGLLPKTIDDEERYLERVSNVDAYDDLTFINFTGLDRLTVQSWRHRILFEAEAHWFQRRGWKLPRTAIGSTGNDYFTRGSYFNLKRVIHRPWFFRLMWPWVGAYALAYALAKDIIQSPCQVVLSHVWEYVRVRWGHMRSHPVYQSLRRTHRGTMGPPSDESEKNMLPLRLGR